jgi:non-ribosomal peptide synthetase component F
VINSDSEEYQKTVYDWNKSDAPYSDDKTIHQLFEEQVKKTPNNIALVFEGESLTYRTLNERANQLAHYLREQYQQTHHTTLKPDTLIALCLERSFEMVIGILGVLKAGGAYVPVEPSYLGILAHREHSLSPYREQ